MRNSRFAIGFALLCVAPSVLAAPRIIEIQAQDQAPDQLAQRVPEKAPGPEQAPAQAQPPAQTQPPARVPADAPAAQPPPVPAPEVANQAPPATVQAQRPNDAGAKDPGRFRFHRVDGGILRLDSASGHMAFCSPRPVGWTCQAVPEDRAALENEIGRLQGEVSDLKSLIADLQAEIATLRMTPPPRPPAEIKPPEEKAPPADQGGSLKMPSEADMARARAAIADAWQRLLDMIGNLQRDMTRKPSSPDGTML